VDSTTANEVMDAAKLDMLACIAFLQAHRAGLHTTHPIECMNGKIERRTDVIGIFPSEGAVMRLVDAIRCYPVRAERKFFRSEHLLRDADLMAFLIDNTLVALPAMSACQAQTGPAEERDGDIVAAPRNGARSNSYVGPCNKVPFAPS
jgi:hypothetical protein